MKTKSWMPVFARIVISVAVALPMLSSGAPTLLAYEEETSAGLPLPGPSIPEGSPAAAPSSARLAGTQWMIEMVDDASASGQYSSLALDPGGHLHVSYYDASNSALRYAYHSGTSWSAETVDNSGVVGQYTSLALDAGDLPHIAYYDATYGIGKPKYAQYTGSAWISETLAYSDDAGRYASLALDSSGDPHISYMDFGAGNQLIYATNDGSWDYTSVDGSGYAEGNISLVLAGGQSPRIAYRDWYSDSLSYASLNGSWTISNANDQDDGGHAASLALDAGELPHISYAKGSDFKRLWYAHHDGSTWAVEAVDSTADVGMFTSLALDASGLPHIAYYDGMGNSVRYAYHDGANWFTETVATGIGMDAHPSLILDGAGYPHITYFHDDQGLKHAWLQLCVAPSVLDLAGPSTVRVGTAELFTATVSAIGATLPITYHWQFPGGGEQTVVLNDLTSSMPIPTVITGTHTIIVTAGNCGGAAITTREVLIQETPLPDLLVTDLWNEGDEVWVQVTNRGTLTATAGHVVSVTADAVLVGVQRVYDALEPGGRWVGTVNATWTCTRDRDTMQATADSGWVLVESDEFNNTRQETWLCDTQPPVITKGPAVSHIITNSAVVSWVTDEVSDSAVQYGATAGSDDDLERDAGLTQNHQITLTGLEPSTAYHGQAVSTDGNGFRTVSAEFYFETAAEPDALPIDPPVFVVRRDPMFDTYTLQVSYADIYSVHAPAPSVQAIERVEFYLESVYVGTDYEDEDGQYEVTLSAHKLGMAAHQFYSRIHTVWAKVYSWARAGQINPYAFAPQRDSIPVDLAITFPADGHTITINGESVPEGERIDIFVEAAQYEWRCTWNGGNIPQSGVAPECGDVAKAVEYVQFIVDNQVQHTSYPSTNSDFSHGWTYELGGVSPLPRTVRVRAFDSDYMPHQVETTINIVQLPPAEPILNVHRTVTRMGNTFKVELVVENEAGATDYAKIDRIEDNVTSFQALHKNALNYKVTAAYDWHWSTAFTSKKDHIDIDVFTDVNDSTIKLDPGESLTVSYYVVPVLYEDQPYFGIGDQNVKVFYEASDQQPELKGFDRHLEFFQGEVGTAIHTSDYLIVTHPRRWIGRFNMASINELLATMAHLAQAKGGVLAYLESDNPREAFDALIEPGGAWATDLNDTFVTPGGGNVLIVGETEIVPAWHIQTPDWQVRDSDQFYSAVGDGPPGINLGRIIGNHPDNIRAVIENTIGVYEGRAGHGFDRSDALLVSGVGNLWDIMVNEVAYVDGVLEGQGTSATVMHWRDYSARSAFMRQYDQYDGMAAGDVIGGDGVDEIVIANDSANAIDIVDAAGNVLGQILRGWEDGDALAVGDVNNDGEDEIVIGDASSDHVYIYEGGGTLLSLFAREFGVHDGLSVGDVVGDGAEEIVIADRDDSLYIFDWIGTLLHSFPRAYARDDRLAVGDVDGAGWEEIVLLQETDQAGNEITATVTSLAVAGGQLVTVETFQLSKYKPGDPLAVGDVTGDGVADIVVGRRHGAIVPYDIDGAWALRPIPCTIDPFDALVVGRFVAGGVMDIAAADLENYYYVAEPSFIDQAHWGYRAAVPDQDLLFFIGHGSPDTWGPGLNSGTLAGDLNSGPHFPLPLGTTNPVVLGSTCLSGNYENGDDYGIAEGFLDSGAAVFIGATENSPAGQTEGALRWFYDHWGQTEAAGKAWFDMERVKWDEGWRSTLHKYNLYGDPKYGAVASMAMAGVAALSAAQIPPTVISIQIPEYEVVSSAEGIDWVTIPGGDLILKEGEVQVPTWLHTVEITRGYRIQDVVLTARTGLSISTGLNLPVTTGDIWGRDADPSAALARGTEAEPEASWTPDLDQTFAWWVADQPDGTSTLMIRVYPFYYNDETTAVRFYDRYAFAVGSTHSDVSLDGLSTDQPTYAQGDAVTIDVELRNGGATQDVVVEAVIKNSASGEIVDGLPLRNLHDLAGAADLSFEWGSSGFDAGSYAVQVALYDGAGNLLDRSSEGFSLGIAAGEVSALTVTPSLFRVGGEVDISLTFSNTGSVSLDGVAVVQVQTGDGITTTAAFTHAITSLVPGNDVVLADSWDTSGVAEGDYRVVGYVTYDSTSTVPVVVPLSTRMRVYLPLTLRNSP